MKKNISTVLCFLVLHTSLYAQNKDYFSILSNAQKQIDLAFLESFREGDVLPLKREEDLLNKISIKNSKHGICDALESPSPGEITFEINNKNNVKGLSVDDEAILHAMKFAYQEFNFMLEPSGAIALACLMSSRSAFEGKKVLILLSGGNISEEKFQKYISI